MARMDEILKKDVIEQLVRDDRTDAANVNVEVSNGTVTLRGEVPTYFSKKAAYEDARDVLGVINVRNQLWVNYSPPVSPPTDLEMENSIKVRLLANPDIELSGLEVTVNGGEVTLKGTVDALWKKLHAEDLVADEAGVLVIENHLAVVPTEYIVDKAVAKNIVDSLEAKAAVNADDVDVRVQDGEVTLNGSVPTWSARQAAIEAAMRTAGVIEVNNHLSIMDLSERPGM